MRYEAVLIGRGKERVAIIHHADCEERVREMVVARLDMKEAICLGLEAEGEAEALLEAATVYGAGEVEFHACGNGEVQFPVKIGTSSVGSLIVTGIGEKKVICVQCNMPNPVGRVTCNGCKGFLWEATESRMYELNKRLREMLKDGKGEKAAAIRSQIRYLVEKYIEGNYAVDERGFAVAKRRDVRGPVPEIPVRTDSRAEDGDVAGRCPCCGKPVAEGEVFMAGHGARVSKMFVQMKTGKIDDLPNDVLFGAYVKWLGGMGIVEACRESMSEV